VAGLRWQARNPSRITRSDFPKLSILRATKTISHKLLAFGAGAILNYELPSAFSA
jgi:hypothetical protein